MVDHLFKAGMDEEGLFVTSGEKEEIGTHALTHARTHAAVVPGCRPLFVFFALSLCFLAGGDGRSLACFAFA